VPNATEAIDRLARLDTSAVSDACDRLGLDRQVITGLANLTVRQRVAGRAVTVLLGPPTPQPPERHVCTAAIEASGPNDVIIVAHQGRTDCAGWGGNLSRAAQARGVIRTIVHGAVRDTNEATDIGYPVYGATTTPRTTRGRAQEHAWNIEIDVAGVTIRPGDLILADTTGIVVIPAAYTDTVLHLATSIVTQESALAAAITAGTPISSVMGAAYEQMLAVPSAEEGPR
jgi:4-hydroxy-4-methyl-2-oxoglutarate aldolase